MRPQNNPSAEPTPNGRHLVLVSNRIPISFAHHDGHLTAKAASGGLVTALEPVVKAHGGVWLGSVEAEDSPELRAALDDASRDLNFRYVPVSLTKEEQANYYEGFSNEVLWPLFHDLQSLCVFNPEYWEFYKSVNRKFAEAAHHEAEADDIIWIQDYQLLLVGLYLRELRPDAFLSMFLHIPFPSPDIFAKLPWSRELLRGMLACNFIGLQTGRDKRNLVSCIRRFAPDIKLSGRGEQRIVISAQHRTSIVAAPISIDFTDFEQSARDQAVVEISNKLQQEHSGRRIILGVDRLDYTKGIPERLRALSALFSRYPEYRGKLTLIQVVVPSREGIPQYQELLAQIERLVSSINGTYGEAAWTPVQYIHRPVDRDELLALYRAAHIALVTPLKDGMNLVAKEYCTSHVDNDGVLILSEFAGAMSELHGGAISVHPYDEVGIAEAIKQAMEFSTNEINRRMTRLRAQIRKADIHAWRHRLFHQMNASQDGAQTMIR